MSDAYYWVISEVDRMPRTLSGLIPSSDRDMVRFDDIELALDYMSKYTEIHKGDRVSFTLIKGEEVNYTVKTIEEEVRIQSKLKFEVTNEADGR